MPPLWAKWADSLKRDAQTYMQKLEQENESLRAKVRVLEVQLEKLQRENMALREKIEGESQHT